MNWLEVITHLCSMLVDKKGQEGIGNVFGVGNIVWIVWIDDEVVGIGIAIMLDAGK